MKSKLARVAVALALLGSLSSCGEWCCGESTTQAAPQEGQPAATVVEPQVGTTAPTDASASGAPIVADDAKGDAQGGTPDGNKE
jgi:hypothetical protein